MAMYDESPNSKRVEISCKNCDKFITFLFIPKSATIIGTPICTIKCEVEYFEKQNKNKENLTEQTLKKNG